MRLVWWCIGLCDYIPISVELKAVKPGIEATYPCFIIFGLVVPLLPIESQVYGIFPMECVCKKEILRSRDIVSEDRRLRQWNGYLAGSIYGLV